MMMSVRPSGGQALSRTISHKASLSPKREVSPSILQSRTPSVSFGNTDDASNQPLFLPEDSMVRAVLFEGKDPVSFAQEMQNSAPYKLKAYPKKVIEAYYTRPGHDDVPVMALLAKTLGWVELFNPKGYLDLYTNKDYALENQLYKDGIERAYLFGEVYPKAFLKQGKLLNAIQSFAKAIEADPEPADSYYRLGQFIHSLIQYRNDFKSAQNENEAFRLEGSYLFEADLESTQFSNHPMLKHRSRQGNGFISTGAGGMTVPLKKEILALNGKPTDFQVLQSQILDLDLMLGDGGLEDLAKEAFEKSARFTEVPSNWDMGNRRQKVYSQSLAQFYAGQPEQAISTMSNYLLGREDGRFIPADQDIPEAMLLTAKFSDQAGLLDEALALTQSAMGRLYWEHSPIECNQQQAFLLDYLKLCQRKANTLPNSTSTTFWQIALPGLESLAANHMPIEDREDYPLPSRIFTVHQFLGEAYRALGDFPKAKSAYGIALKSMEYVVENIKEWHQNQTMAPETQNELNRIDEIQAETERSYRLVSE
jgi:tetratricopeptide (TPR) repeat protein